MDVVDIQVQLVEQCPDQSIAGIPHVLFDTFIVHSDLKFSGLLAEARIGADDVHLGTDDAGQFSSGKQYLPVESLMIRISRIDRGDQHRSL